MHLITPSRTVRPTAGLAAFKGSARRQRRGTTANSATARSASNRFSCKLKHPRPASARRQHCDTAAARHWRMLCGVRRDGDHSSVLPHPSFVSRTIAPRAVMVKPAAAVQRPAQIVGQKYSCMIRDPHCTAGRRRVERFRTHRAPPSIAATRRGATHAHSPRIADPQWRRSHRRAIARRGRRCRSLHAPRGLRQRHHLAIATDAFRPR